MREGEEGVESVEGEGGGKGVCREWTNFCKAASGSGRLEIGLDNLLEISSSFAFVGDEDTGYWF